MATDILSRGIDIDTIDIVINFDIPHDGEDYVHRIGRTARAEQEGMAFTFVGEREQNRFASIEALLGKPVDKALVPEQLGPTPGYQPGRHSGKRPGGQKSFQRDKRNHRPNTSRKK